MSKRNNLKIASFLGIFLLCLIILASSCFAFFWKKKVPKDTTKRQVVAQEAPNFTLVNLSLNPAAEEKKIVLKELTPSCDVLLVFWASWCGACLEEIPDLINLHQKYHKQGLKILSVHLTYNDSVKKGREIIKKYQVPYLTLSEQTGKVADAYQIQSIPTNILLDRKGKIIYRGYALPKEMISQKYQKK